ncbi:NAD(P)-dependent glycerol-3-phosphate dehydrogenase [Hydrogenobacter sp. T-2]|uniref:NAD(P)H-dependent glycerol-3-phosphate dehydrogenase n=1 Tax=Pampinifervens diazotrophicum TaxID=1632018 RepID=UPI002B2598F5|nr:NAD(P)H-dependent glycerol-3-phosphate dehydrogenase [Hydrogenobacter sp. T-2]WPM31211.1 NAD(P)-dependent glycerol-3-phosphate dehydrogenase [Hydrogenobacter sp. T-2]
MNFSVLGGGRWGTALALHLGNLGHRVLVFERKEETVRLIKEGKHPHMEGVKLRGVDATQDLDKAIDFSDYIIVALPVQAIREVLGKKALSDKRIISASKGLEVGTEKRVSQILLEIEPSVKVFCLSGPSFASEVSKGLPTALVLAGNDLEEMEKVRKWISSENFRVYLSTDLIGVELGGALKNVIAIACGISDGLGLGENARASLMTRGLAEMVRLGVSLGAKKETFYGLSGMGDLFLTASSPQSRNRTLGYLLGQGLSVQEALQRLNQTVEGIHTVKAVYKISTERGLYAPISTAVYKVVVEGFPPKETALELLRRPPQNPLETL